MLAPHPAPCGSRGSAGSRSAQRTFGLNSGVRTSALLKRCVMSMTKSDKIWMNGAWVAWDDAKVHVLSHVLHYGSSVFEGIRCYHTRRGPAIFRLREHMQRLLNSAKVYRMDHK